MKPETRLKKALERLDKVLYEEYGLDSEMPEQECKCEDHVVKTVAPENVEVFMLLMNMLSLLLPHELGECELNFSNCGSSIVLNRQECDCCKEEEGEDNDEPCCGDNCKGS